MADPANRSKQVDDLQKLFDEIKINPAKAKDAKDTKLSASELKDQIIELEKHLAAAIKKKAGNQIVMKLHQLVNNKKEQLAALEQHSDEETNGETMEIDRLDSDLQQLYAERTRIDQLIELKEAQLRSLTGDDTKEDPNQSVLHEDDMERLTNNRVDRRQQYREAYGVDPSDPKGVILATSRKLDD